MPRKAASDGARTPSGSENGRDLAVLMAAVAEGLHQQSETENVLRAVVLAARDTIPGVEHAGISIAHRNGRIETVAASSSLVYQADELQYRLREGPCVDALAGLAVSATGDLATDDRWPRYAPAAAELGVGSQMGVQLFDEDRSLAGLNLYATALHAFGPETVQIAGLFAVHAAHALGRTMTEHQLTEALSTRKVTGQAVGIIMERYQLSEQQAFTFLVRASQHSNTKLRLVATQIVDDLDRAGTARAQGTRYAAAGPEGSR